MARTTSLARKQPGRRPPASIRGLTPDQPTRQPARREPPLQVPDGATGERLHKLMAACGIGSRRHCEQIILEGRVEVDGQTVMELGTRVYPEVQEIRVDGASLKPARSVYYLVNKPVGVVTTNYDQSGRKRIVDLVPPAEHLFAVGRLDKSSEGLILVTNDGALANRMAHPKFGVEKCYRVVVTGHPDFAALQQLRDGVFLAEGRVQAAELRIHQQRKKHTVLEMVLTEGRNREIRRMLARIGHKVVELKRVSFGPLRLGNIPPGAYRELSSSEVRSLQTYRPQAAEPKPKRRLKPVKRVRTSESFGGAGTQRKKPTSISRSVRSIDREGRSEGKTEVRPKRRPEGRTDGRPKRRPEGRPEGRPDGRPEGRPKRRTEGKSEGRPDGRPEGRPRKPLSGARKKGGTKSVRGKESRRGPVGDAKQGRGKSGAGKPRTGTVLTGTMPATPASDKPKQQKRITTGKRRPSRTPSAAGGAGGHRKKGVKRGRR